LTQITFTDDALVPKCITFGGTTNVVRWYAYIRSTGSNDIYLQRSVDGVLDPEVLVVQANPPAFGAPQPGLSYFNFIADPSDNTKAHLYFLSDGTLFRITVTSTPIGEEPTTQQFDRVNNRADTTRPELGLGSLLIPGVSGTAIPRPSVALVRSETPGQRLLIITVNNGPDERRQGRIVEVYRAQNQANSVLYDTLFVGEPTSSTYIQLVLEVPAAVSPNEELWHVRSLNPAFNTISEYTHVFDNGNDPTAEATSAEGFSQLGSHLTPVITKVSRLPIKIARNDVPENVQPFSGVGSHLTPVITKQTIEPIKFIEQEPNQNVQPFSGLGSPLTPIVTKQRVV
jgi:hypothetical protein